MSAAGIDAAGSIPLDTTPLELLELSSPPDETLTGTGTTPRLTEGAIHALDRPPLISRPRLSRQFCAGMAEQSVQDEKEEVEMTVTTAASFSPEEETLPDGPMPPIISKTQIGCAPEIIDPSCNMQNPHPPEPLRMLSGELDFRALIRSNMSPMSSLHSLDSHECCDVADKTPKALFPSRKLRQGQAADWRRANSQLETNTSSHKSLDNLHPPMQNGLSFQSAGSFQSTASSMDSTGGVEFPRAAPNATSFDKPSSRRKSMMARGASMMPRRLSNASSVSKHSWKSGRSLSALSGNGRRLSGFSRSGTVGSVLSWITLLSGVSEETEQSNQTGTRLSRHDMDVGQWEFIRPCNSNLVFPSGSLPISCGQAVGASLLLLLSSTGLTLLLSDMGTALGAGSSFGHGLKLYTPLIAADPLKVPILASAFLCAYALHALDWYNWQVHYVFKALPGTMVLFMFLIGAACFTRAYPQMPLIIALAHLPFLLTLFRVLGARSCSTGSFYKFAGVACGLVSLVLLVCWIAWVYVSDNRWTSDSSTSFRAHILEQMHDVYLEYEIPSWQYCEDGRSGGASSLSASPEELAACSRVELIGFLIWIFPFMESLLFLGVAIFSAIRVWFLSQAEGRQHHMKLKLILASFVLLIGALWSTAAVRGASMQLSNVVLSLVGVVFLGCGIWLSFTLTLDHVIASALQLPLVMALRPVVVNDGFKSLLLCGTLFFVLLFYALEVSVRFLERLFGVPGPHPYLTARALYFLDGTSGWHWGYIFESAFTWCVMFLAIFVLGGQVSVVLLVWLQQMLVDVSLLLVCGLFYLIGIVVFLFPAMPSIPIYLSCAIVIVSRAKSEPYLGFGGGVVLACVECLSLKLVAHVLEQKLFGEMLGKSLLVQRCVGVHTIWIRAIEHILAQKGLRCEKVVLLIGGPDWPTSVLTGILGCNVYQMLAGTLPVALLIIPTVLAGATLSDKDHRGYSSITVAAMTLLQGGTMAWACVIILMVVHRNKQELAEARKDHDAIYTYCKRQAIKKRLHKLCSEWESLSLLNRALLFTSTILEVGCCWLLFFCSDSCFRSFTLVSDIGAPFEEKGLDGDITNILKPFGVCVIGAASLGIVLMGLFQALRLWEMRDMEATVSQFGELDLDCRVAKRGHNLNEGTGCPPSPAIPGEACEQVDPFAFCLESNPEVEVSMHNDLTPKSGREGVPTLLTATPYYLSHCGSLHNEKYFNELTNA